MNSPISEKYLRGNHGHASPQQDGADTTPAAEPESSLRPRPASPLRPFLADHLGHAEHHEQLVLTINIDQLLAPEIAQGWVVENVEMETRDPRSFTVVLGRSEVFGNG